VADPVSVVDGAAAVVSRVDVEVAEVLLKIEQNVN
jgi:hypothetical protein